MGVRRVVTGVEASGRSVIASDEVVEPVTISLAPGLEFHELWSTDGPRRVPDAVGQPDVPSFFPGPDGTVARIWTLPPASQATVEEADLEAALTEAEAKLPGMVAHMEPDEPGMHTSDRVDDDVVLVGEVVLEVDDGVETPLRPGDLVVQNGTRHRWHNRTDAPASVLSVLLGATRAP